MPFGPFSGFAGRNRGTHFEPGTAERRRRPERPENAYQSMVVGLWPQLGVEDPHQYHLDTAYRRVTTNRQLNLEKGEWEPIRPSERDARRGVADQPWSVLRLQGPRGDLRPARPPHRPLRAVEYGKPRTVVVPSVT